MDIEVDQSGKIETTSVDSIIAFSNEKNGTVVVPAVVKRACINSLKQKGWNRQTFIYKIFAASIFLLIEKHLTQIDRIVIDTEYEGHDGEIKGMLLRHIRSSFPNFRRDQIVFRQIGKKSHAHKIGIAVYRGEREPDRILTAREILKVLGK